MLLYGHCSINLTERLRLVSKVRQAIVKMVRLIEESGRGGEGLGARGECLVL